jgi:hypothetical protein
MIVIVRIDLDQYSIEMIERFVLDGIVSLSEARDARCAKALGDLAELMWVRKMQAIRSGLKVG